MHQFALIWIAAICFTGVVFYGMNVPTSRRTPAIIWITGIIILFQIFTQGYLFKVDASPTASPESRQAAVDSLIKFKSFLAGNALEAGILRDAPLSAWYRVVTSTLLHYGWLHMFFNLWFFVLFGHVLEHFLGIRKFLLLFLTGLLIPALLDGFAPLGLPARTHTGGMSGIVYCLAGAYFMIFPRSRVYGAVNYDLRFWAAICFILLPVTSVTRLAGMALTEVVLMLGFAAAFLLIQPEHKRISLPVAVLILLKLTQDVLLIQPSTDEVLSNSMWRIGGGFTLGLGMGFLFNGRRGWAASWKDEVGQNRKIARQLARGKTAVARLEGEGRNSIEAARVYLGQRVFVGDADRAISFYRDVVIPKYPDLMLPLQEQIALARLLQFKGKDPEALHAYEQLLKYKPGLPDEYWTAWLKTAELVMKLIPDDTSRARGYLDRFQQGNNIMTRDRIEAERLRASLPVVETSVDVPVSMPKVRSARKKILQASDIAPVEFSKLQPLTFQYVPGEATVSLHIRKVNETHPDTLVDPDFLKIHWKPLPSIASTKPESMLDRRIKNYRVPDEDNKPSMYAGSKALGGRAPTRLANLEVDGMINLPEAVTVTDMPGQYGGLGDYQPTVDMTRIRLRGEKDPPENPPRRRLVAGPGKDKLDWTRPLEVDLKSDLFNEEDFYGEMIRESEDRKKSSDESLNHHDIVEVFGFSVDETGCLFKTTFGSRRISWSEVNVIGFGRMKLTSSSTSEPRLMLDFVMRDLHRYQVFEKTLNLKGSLVDKRSYEDAEELLLAAWEFMIHNVKSVRRFPADRIEVQSYLSYAHYNNELENYMKS